MILLNVTNVFIKKTKKMIYIFEWLIARYVCNSYKTRPSGTPTEKLSPLSQPCI